MKKSEKQSLREMSIQDLEQKVADSRKELMQARFKRAVENEGGSTTVRNTKRGIARMLSIIAEKKQVSNDE